MDFPDFELERVQSIWENQVDYNLTESGLHPFTLRELLDDRQLDQLLSLRLGYTQTNGTVALRQAISSRYAGAGIDNVLVTSGSAEANFIASIQTLKPGDEISVTGAPARGGEPSVWVEQVILNGAPLLHGEYTG